MSRDISLEQYIKEQNKKQTDLKKRLSVLETNDTLPSVWDEYYIATGSARLGASAPTRTLRAMGAFGTLLFDVLQFSLVAQNDVYFEWHVPKTFDNRYPAQFHLMWLPGSAWSTGFYSWRLEYLVKGEGDPYNTGTPSTLPMDITPVNNTDLIETEFTGGITCLREQIVSCHFYRDITDTADDTGDVNFFELVYRTDRRGSTIP